MSKYLLASFFCMVLFSCDHKEKVEINPIKGFGGLDQESLLIGVWELEDGLEKGVLEFREGGLFLMNSNGFEEIEGSFEVDKRQRSIAPESYPIRFNLKWVEMSNQDEGKDPFADDEGEINQSGILDSENRMRLLGRAKIPDISFRRKLETTQP